MAWRKNLGNVGEEVAEEADPSSRLCDFAGERKPTCQTAVTLKHSLHIGLAALKRV